MPSVRVATEVLLFPQWEEEGPVSEDAGPSLVQEWSGSSKLASP